jgi:diguanylate cyclase (GGDEF)-like protein/PAS domain S-box-containing protein
MSFLSIPALASVAPDAVTLGAAAASQLEDLLTSGVHPIVVTDTKRRIQWVNDAFVERTGYTLQDCAGRNPGDFLQCPQTNRQAVAALRTALDAGCAAKATLLNRARDGSLYWVDLDIHPFGPPGQISGFVAVQINRLAGDVAVERVSNLLETLAGGAVLHDHTGRIIHCNRAAERMLGRTHDEIFGATAGDPGWALIDSTGQPLTEDRAPASRTLATGKPLKDELIGVRLPSGGLRWLSVNTVLLPQEHGHSLVMASFTDVTALREQEMQLHDEWHRLRQTLIGSRTATWEWNVQSGTLTIDERWAEIIGYRVEDLQPVSMDTWFALDHPEDQANVHEKIRRHFAGETEHYEVESRIRHRDGHWVWVLDRGRLASRSADGKPLTMLGTHEDITQRKQAEMAAKAQQGMLDALFNLAVAGINLVDLSTGLPVDVNPAMCELLGWSREELIGEAWMRCMPEDKLALRKHLLERVLVEGRFGPLESARLHKDGHRVDVLMTGARVTGVDGRAYVWVIYTDISERKALDRELRAAAEQDRLTGLANRAVLTRRLEDLVARHATDPSQRFAVLFLDLDRFKLINDTLGHEAGDALLIQMAERLSDIANIVGADGEASESIATRFGGDEFIFLVAGIKDADGAHAIAERIHATLAQPYRLPQRTVQSTVSIGIAMGGVADATPHELIRNADTAMYEAKRAGRGVTVLFDHAMHERLTRMVRIEAGLRHAIERREFTVLYQPIVDLNSGRMTSVEALLRWDHDELGSVSPVEFIPVAEDSGLIVGIGEWVLNESCRQWAAWQAQDPARAPAGMSVNLSRVQMGLGVPLIDTVRAALDRSGMPASALQLEITEREVMKSASGALPLMQSLVALGVKLAMDDFGTGASSLGCLREFPFHTIKIDKSFVTDLAVNPHVLAVAHATVSVIDSLGMTSVAEGIENPDELATLQGMGCQYGQGYLFAKPLPADQVLGAMGRALPSN